MKQIDMKMANEKYGPAAFRRLCVETGDGLDGTGLPSPAAFRRLCVET